MLGSPAGPGGPSQRGGLWPIAPATAPTTASFTTDGLSKYGIYSLFPGTPNFGNALYSHSAIGRFTSGSLQSSPTTFHATHKDSVFSSGYTFGAPTPPPGSPYSPVPVTQLELFAKGFNSNIIIQQPEYPLSPKKTPFTENKQPQQRCEEKCCASIKTAQKPCMCSSSPSSTTATGAKTKFVENASGCSRTNPVDWSPVCVKKEPGTPCQVAEITTSVSPMVKIEVTSPTSHKLGLQHDVHSIPPVVTTNGNIPVGIAVARQRIQQHDLVSSPSLPPAGLLTTVNTSTQIKEMSRISEIDSTPGMAANTSGGVPANGGTLMHCTDDRTTGLAGWPLGGTHSSALTAPTLWQYPASLPMEPLMPMSVPIPPVGFQLVRDPNIGGLLLLPSTEPLHQAVVWPSYPQPSSHVLLPQIPPPPLQLLSSASSDYLSSSTTLHQHTQTHSTRLVAVTTDTKRKIPLPIPATTLIKIETDATTLDQTKTLQAVSTIASNTATVFTDQHVAPLVTTHVIYQHPTNLILSQTPAPETACRSQATSPVSCLTPPPENNPQNEEESLGVQDASNQTESPICSEDDATIHAITEETKSRIEELPKINQEDELPIHKVPEKIEEPPATPPKTFEHIDAIKEPEENEPIDSQPAPLERVEPLREENREEEEVKPDSTQEKIQEKISLKPDLSGLELLSSIVEFENCRKSIEKIHIKQEVPELKIENEQNEEVLKGIAHMTLKDHEVELLPKKSEDTFGGLDLLCALAEQRILEEVTEKKKLETVNRDKEERDRQERKKEKRKSKKHSDEPKHKKSKYSMDENNLKMRHHSDKRSRHERRHGSDSIEFSERIRHSSSEINKNHCSCRTDDSYRTYKTRESEEEVKKFIASKSQPLCCKGDWPCMNPNELDMRKKLADLQKKYREKQMELHKLKVKKYTDCPKKSKSKKKSIHSDRDRGTPPPLLDKMDVPLRPHKNNQELLKPPTLCAYGNEDVKSTKLEIIIKDVEMDSKEDFTEDCPVKRCYTPSIDLSDSTPEKISSSSKKRKVGRPKKLLTSSGLRTGTETIVAKKPKKGNIVGYLLAAKEKLMQSKNGQLYSNSPPRFVEETVTTTTATTTTTSTTATPKHKSSRSKSEENHSKKKHDKKNEKCKIRPKLKAEPMVKKFAEEEELHHEWSKEIVTVEAEPEETEQTVEEEEVKEEEEEEDPIEEEVVSVKDDKCILTAEHLDTDKLRVLTAMGGLFYAGHLNAVEPPDVYSITLDGERGNRPHIMSREEILRDAIVEVAPSSTEELLVGTRICAYWSQQYRCLYPGSVAEPGTPDPALDSKFVSVEFDDGDSGRIALEDIRLLPPDYPIIEYDPNPLLSLSKRRRRTSTAEDKQRSNQTPMVSSLAPSLPTIQEIPSKHKDVEKENKDTNKGDADSHRERKRLKKRKREKLKQKLLHEDKKKKKKHKCNDENCKHKKHHKKHRKHKKHHHSKEAEEEKKFEEITEVPEIEENDEEEDEENDEEQQDSFEENGDEFPEYQIIANPEDEVTMDDILEDKKKKSKKIRDRQESCESRSKMSAFLPARQLWGWSGKGYRRPKAKGRTRKQFFKAIQRGKETIQVGDSAVFLSTGRPDRPYIGKIEAMWEACGTMVVKVKWFYHPEETIGCPLNLQYPGALFESPHVDENDVQTISHKCEVLPLDEYTEKLGDDPQRYATIYDNNDIYYLAGYYDPTTTSLKIEPNIPFSNAD